MPGFRNASSRRRLARMSNLNSVVMVKMVGSGLKVISVPVPLDLPMTVELLRRHAAREFHRIHLSVARHLDLEPVGQRVDAFRADAVQAAGVFVGALPEFAARVQVGQHQLDGGHLPFRMHVHRDAAAVVADGDRAIHVDGDFDFVAIAGQMLVNGVVQHLEDAVVQAALVRVADIHAGPLAHRLQTLQFVNFDASYFSAALVAGLFSDSADSVFFDIKYSESSFVSVKFQCEKLYENCRFRTMINCRNF